MLKTPFLSERIKVEYHISLFLSIIVKKCRRKSVEPRFFFSFYYLEINVDKLSSLSNYSTYFPGGEQK
jgi:hypothetical protein